MGLDPRDVELRARRGLERGRTRAALFVSSPLLGVGLGVAALSGLEYRALFLSVAAYLLVAWLWWRGTSHIRSIAPGIVAGTSLLVATFVAHGVGGHACDLEECVAHCAPIGAAGGFGSGLVLSLWALRVPSVRTAVWWAESLALAAAFGSIGCSCIGFIGGFAGLGGMALLAMPAAFVLRRPA